MSTQGSTATSVESLTNASISIVQTTTELIFTSKESLELVAEIPVATSTEELLQ